jgi:NADH:ubiquinone oxidoreductase subunit 6 (subunit J)
MTIALYLIALILLGSAAIAMLLRNLVHSVLLLTVSWLGTAAFYLWAGAEFAAFAQVIVYVGAVSMVVLFAVLLTRQSPVTDMTVEPASRVRASTALLVGASVAAILVPAVLRSEFRPAPAAAPAITVQQIGLELMNRHGAALLIVGVLLTVALLGAIVLAATDRVEGRGRPLGGPLPPEDVS